MPVDPKWLLEELKYLYENRQIYKCPDCNEVLIQEEQYLYCDNCGFISWRD